jgi:hypothetical protein
MHVTRRDFVETAFAMAAAALAAAPASSHAEQPASDAPSRSPSDRLRVAVVGANGRGGEHIGQWSGMSDAEVAVICDCDPSVASRYEEKFKDAPRKPEYVEDIRRVLDRKDIDIVSIATPNHWHTLMGIWAMQAGKDVYVEKPLSHTVEEGRVLTQWARKLGRMCQMGAQSRGMTGMRDTIDFVKSGKIGAVKVAHALCYKRRKSIGLVDKPAPVPPGMDFDLWAGPAPDIVPHRQRLHYDWHWNRLTGNGDLGNQNPHELDKARWGLGKQEFPKRVVSLGGRLGYVDNGDVANSQVTIFEWDDALLISDVRGLEMKTPVTHGTAAGPLGVGNIWWGTEGYVVSTNYQSGAAFDYAGTPLGTWSGGSSRDHFANLVKAIRSRKHEDLYLDVEDGHLSSALAHLGNVSWQLGEKVPFGTRPTIAAGDHRVLLTLDSFEDHLRDNAVDLAVTPLHLGRELVIDPKTETSTDEAANRLFTKDYRKGYELPRV